MDSDVSSLQPWQRRLDVVNCAGLPREVIYHGVYLCPATGGNYSHQRCRFFGMYRNKRVEQVALVRAVVDVESISTAKCKWKNVDQPYEELVAIAQAKHGECRPADFPTRVFVLGPLAETDFVKDTPGGMLPSKQYFDIGQLNVESAEELAAALRGKTWTELRAMSVRQLER